MAKQPGLPPLDGLKRRIARHREENGGGQFVRQTYRLPREDAREKAREWFSDYPKAAYWTVVETWRQTEDGEIEFTMRRLNSAD